MIVKHLDVHHGNGTEETVKWLKPHVGETQLINPSFFGNINSPRYKPWFDSRDHQNVFFVSVHGYGPRERGLEHVFPLAAFFPGSGATTLPIVANATSGIVRKRKLDPLENDELSVNESAPSNFYPYANEILERLDDGKSALLDETGYAKFNTEEREFDGSERSNSSIDDENNSVENSISDMNPVDHIQGLKEIYHRPLLDSDDELSIAPPLILDVGVSLPDEEDEMSSSTSLDRQIAELSYRIQWKNYFR